MSKEGYLIRGLYHEGAKCIFELRLASNEEYQKIRHEPDVAFFALSNEIAANLFRQRQGP